MATKEQGVQITKQKKLYAVNENKIWRQKNAVCDG